MSGKKLLAENTIRQFMKLANIEPLTSNFISENYGEDDELEEMMDEEEDPIEEAEEELEVDMGEEPELDMDEEPELDMGAEEEPEMGVADMSLTEEEAQLLVSLGERLATALEGQGEGDELPGDEEMPELEDEAPADEEMPLEDEEEAPGMRYENQDALVQEIMKRVTKRIISARNSRK
ncbi:hypothetical protein OAA64_01000 [bacterium]|nr:hypothetical protein [bacterium]